MPIPDHLQRFPSAKPFIGQHYQDPRHKRLLVMGESHYFPEGSTSHLDSNRWYDGHEEELSQRERKYIHTRDVVKYHWDGPPRGLFFRNIRRAVADVLQAHGMGKQEETVAPGNWVHVAFCNYFVRPAPYSGKSIKDGVVDRDQEVADQVLQWIITRHKPELVIVASVLVGGYAGRILNQNGIPYRTVPHPNFRCPWWHTRAASYGNRSGRELFCDFLKEQAWVTTG